MNTYRLRELVKRRIPGYDDSEYLSELNEAYREVWEELTKLDDEWAADVQTVTVATDGATTFDFVFNGNAALSAAVSPFIYQVKRIRVLPPNSNYWQPGEPRDLNSSDFLSAQQDNSGQVQSGGRYFYYLYGNGNTAIFTKPVALNTKFEVTYTFGRIDLAIQTLGTVVSLSTAVTGTNTKFTKLLPPDFVTGFKPGTNANASIRAEITTGTVSLDYRVTAIASDTALTTAVAIAPVAAGDAYFLSTVPYWPVQHHGVIATLATRNMMSTPHNDDRYGEWAQKAEREIASMKDALTQRNKQHNPRKTRFPSGRRF